MIICALELHTTLRNKIMRTVTELEKKKIQGELLYSPTLAAMTPANSRLTDM